VNAVFCFVIFFGALLPEFVREEGSMTQMKKNETDRRQNVYRRLMNHWENRKK
jgi:hypothetical protein